MSRSKKQYIIADLGASNGRVLLGSFDGSRMQFETLLRFDNAPVLAAGVSYWDILYLFENIKQGIQMALAKADQIVSIALDTWGLDFSFTDHNHEILYNPVTYRDASKIDYDPSPFYEEMSLQTYFLKTGWLNSSLGPPFYLHHQKNSKKTDSDQVHKFLMMPDLLNHLLTSVYSNEFSISSNSLMLNCHKKSFDEDIISVAGLRKENFSLIVNPAEKIGHIRKDPMMDGKAQKIEVVACASHDTASAVCGIPAAGSQDWAFVSLGTWCVFGTETERPVLDMEILQYGMTNEGISKDQSFLAKNMTGLWVVQQCMDKWQRSASLSYEELDRMVPFAERFAGFIDLDDPVFAGLQPDMPSLVFRDCAKNGFKLKNSIPAIAGCIYESIVCIIKYYFHFLARYSQKDFQQVFLFGGGAKNRLFCQWLADALQIPVTVSHPESTSVGNMLMQLIADGEAKDLGEARQIVRDSFETRTYKPKEVEMWQQGYAKYFRDIKGGKI